MRISEITESRIDEKPTSGIGNFAKKWAGKAAGAVGMTGTAGRLQGAAQMGGEANQIYKALATWQGINQKNDNNMTGADLQAFAKQQKLNLKGITIPDGVLPKQTVMGILKKAAASKLTGGNIGQDPAPSAADAAGTGGATPQAQGGGVINKALGALQGATGKPGNNNTPSNATPAADEPGSQAQTAQPQDKSNVTPLKNKAGIPPNIQKALDDLTPTEKKALAGVI
jgi:hypothetical protein